MARTLKTFRQPHFAEAGHDGFLVLTPHRAAAASIGVATKTLESVAREIVTEAGYVIASDLTALMTLRAAVKAVLPGEKPSAYMSRIAKILDTVLRVGLDTKVLCASPSRKIQELGMVAEKYVALLRAQNLIDRAETLMCAASVQPERRKIAVYGYFRGRTQEAKLIDALAGDGSVFYLPTGDADWFGINRRIARQLESQGWVSDGSGGAELTAGSDAADVFSNADSRDLAGRCRALKYSNREKEIRGTLAQVKNLILGGVAAHDVAILCRRTSDYGPETAQIADEYGMRVDMSFSMPLHETTFGGFMQLVMDVVKAPAYENVLRLLMHPFGPRMRSHHLRQAFKQHPETAEQWNEVGVDTSFMFAPEKLSRGEWKTFLEDLLRHFKTKRSVGAKAREMIAFNAFNDCLHEFCFEGREELSRAQFAAELGEILWSCSVPFSPARGGIGFHDPDTIIGGRFKHLFVMGAAEGDLPASVSDSPVVDFLERKALADQGVFFESASDITRWELLSFYFTLLCSSDSITISFPQMVKREEKMESELIGRLGLSSVEMSSDLEFASSGLELRRFKIRTADASDDDVLNRARNSYKVERRRESSNPQDEFDGNIGTPYENAEHDWSASQLTTIGQCGFKWFAQKLLRLRPVDEMDVELTAKTLGSLYHGALELAAKEAIGAPNAREKMLEVLEAAFSEAERDPDLKLPVLQNWEVQRKEFIAKLRQVIRSDDFIMEGATIVAAEAQFNSHWRGFKVNGKIDRVDRTEEGFIVVDYKSGSKEPLGAKNAKGSAVVDIQVPLYLEAGIPMVASSGGTSGVEGIYFSISSAEAISKVRLENDDELDAFVERVKTMLSTGDFSVSPPVEKKVCKYCDMNSVCRRGNRIKRKEAGKNTDEAV